MAELFGAVASGAGLISLSLQLLRSSQKLKTLWDNSKNAPDTLLGLSHDLETVSLLVKELDRHTRQDGADAILLARCVAQCERNSNRIGALVERLERRLRALKGIGRVLVAFKDDDTCRLMTDLEQAKTSAMLAYTMYTNSQQALRHEQQMARLNNLQQNIGHSHAAILGHIHSTAPLTSPSPTGETATGCSVDLDGQNGPGEVAGPAEAITVPFRRRKRQPERSYHIRIAVTWITNTIWHVTATRAVGGWDVCLRTWNLRPEDAPIFGACRSGDTDTVRRLFNSGDASPFDTLGNDFNLLLYAVAYCKPDGDGYELCRYLLENTDLSCTEVADDALAHWTVFSDPTDFEACERVYRLFVQTSDATIESDSVEEAFPDERPAWQRWIADRAVRVVKAALADRPMKNALTILFDYLIDYHTWHSRAVLLLEWLASRNPGSEVACYRHRDGCTALHFVGEFFHTIVTDKSRTAYGQTCEGTLQGLLYLGADPHALWRHKTPFRLLLELVMQSANTPDESSLKLEHAREAISWWSDCLQAANVDLLEYAEVEARLWAALSSRICVASQLWPDDTTRSTLWITKPILNRRTGKIDVAMRYTSELMTAQAESLPGCWDKPGGCSSTATWWDSSGQGREQAFWTVLCERQKVGKAFALSDYVDILDREFVPHDGVAATQDDHGIIALRTIASEQTDFRRRCHSAPAAMNRRRVPSGQTHVVKNVGMDRLHN